MFSITVLAMGKLKEKFYLAAAQEYAKRLSGYGKFQLTELPEHRLPDNPSPGEIDAGLAREAELIRQKLPRGAWLCVLTPEGRELSSGICPAAGPGEAVRPLRGLFSHWFILWPAPFGEGPGGLLPVHGEDDLPPPPGPDHGAGAAVPGGGHSGRQPLP